MQAYRIAEMDNNPVHKLLVHKGKVLKALQTAEFDGHLMIAGRGENTIFEIAHFSLSKELIVDHGLFKGLVSYALRSIKTAFGARRAYFGLNSVIFLKILNVIRHYCGVNVAFDSIELKGSGVENAHAVGP